MRSVRRGGHSDICPDVVCPVIIHAENIRVPPRSPILLSNPSVRSSRPILPSNSSVPSFATQNISPAATQTACLASTFVTQPHMLRATGTAGIQHLCESRLPSALLCFLFFFPWTERSVYMRTPCCPGDTSVRGPIGRNRHPRYGSRGPVRRKHQVSAVRPRQTWTGLRDAVQASLRPAGPRAFLESDWSGLGGPGK